MKICYALAALVLPLASHAGESGLRSRRAAMKMLKLSQLGDPSDSGEDCDEGQEGVGAGGAGDVEGLGTDSSGDLYDGYDQEEGADAGGDDGYEGNVEGAQASDGEAPPPVPAEGGGEEPPPRVPADPAGSGSGNNGGTVVYTSASNDPEYLKDSQLPPGFVRDPSRVVGVDFKSGRKPTAQRLPPRGRGRKVIKGFDKDCAIELDPAKAEVINMYNPDNYALSDDGTYVINSVSGEVIPLTAYYQHDEKCQNDIVWAVDEYESLFHVRVTPKSKPLEGREMLMVQNFQRIDGTEILVGYLDDDVDLTQSPRCDNDVKAGRVAKPVPDELVGVSTKNRNNGQRGYGGRKLQASSYPITRFGKTCTTFDYLNVAITTDEKFKQVYAYDQARVQAIVAEASQIYWLESCVYLQIPAYENTIRNNWVWEEYPQHQMYSGCTSPFGSIDMLRWEAKYFHDHVDRDAWHLFSGILFQDGYACSWQDTCKSTDFGYGVEHMTWTTSLRYQAVLFAHELGHNLDLPQLSTDNGYWMMEPYVSLAPYNMYPSNGGAVQTEVLGTSMCGTF